MSQCPIPNKISLKKDHDLTLVWNDGTVSVYPIAYLRRNCPCAACKQLRESQAKSRLTVLQGNFTPGPITVLEARLIGNYAIQLDWSDNHGSGIYSFSYLWEITPPQNKC
jgi:DUF971 family protein